MDQIKGSTILVMRETLIKTTVIYYDLPFNWIGCIWLIIALKEAVEELAYSAMIFKNENCKFLVREISQYLPKIKNDKSFNP